MFLKMKLKLILFNLLFDINFLKFFFKHISYKCLLQLNYFIYFIFLIWNHLNIIDFMVSFRKGNTAKRSYTRSNNFIKRFYDGHSGYLESIASNSSFPLWFFIYFLYKSKSIRSSHRGHNLVWSMLYIICSECFIFR